MILECAHCGAPLEAGGWGGLGAWRRTKRCNYCGRTNVRAAMRKLHEAPPPGFERPKAWTPPPHAKVKSAEPLAYKRDVAPILGVGGFFLATLALAAFMDEGLPRLRGATPADLAAEPIERTPAQAAADLPGAVASSSGKKVRVTLRKGTAGAYTDAELDWYGTLDAPSHFVLHAPRESPAPAAVRAALESSFHGGFENDAWSWGAVTVRAYAWGDVDVTVERKGNPLFARQMRAVRDLVYAAAFGLPSKTPRQEIFDVLGGGYPIADVGATIDPAAPVDRDVSAIAQRFPGFLRSGDAIDVAVDHPLFYAARFDWTSMRGGSLESFELREAPAFAAARSRFVDCLAERLGGPHDDREGRPTFTLAGRAELVVDSPSVAYTHHGAETDAATWKRVFAALDACR